MFKVSPPLSGGSQKIHSIKCAKLLTSTVVTMPKSLSRCSEKREIHSDNQRIISLIENLQNSRG